MDTMCVKVRQVTILSIRTKAVLSTHKFKNSKWALCLTSYSNACYYSPRNQEFQTEYF